MAPVNDEYGGPPKNTRYKLRSTKTTAGGLIPTTTHQSPSSSRTLIEKKKMRTGGLIPTTTHQSPSSSRTLIEKKKMKTGVSKPPKRFNTNYYSLGKGFDDDTTRLLEYSRIRASVLGEVARMINGAVGEMENMLFLLKEKLDAHEDRGPSVAFYLETQRELLDSVGSQFKLKRDTADLQCQPPRRSSASEPPRSSNKIDMFKKELYNDDTRFLDYACMRVGVLSAVAPSVYGALSEMQDMLAKLKSKLCTHEDSGPSVASYLDMQMRQIDTLHSTVYMTVGTAFVVCPPRPNV